VVDSRQSQAHHMQLRSFDNPRLLHESAKSRALIAERLLSGRPQRMCEATDRQAIQIGAIAAGWDSCYTSSASEPMLNAPLNSDGHLKVGHYKQCSSCPHRTPDPESTRICAKPHSQWQRMASTCDAISALTFEIVAVVSRFDSGNSLPLQTNQGRRSLSVQAPRRTKATAG
jgi:hypothetical protein